MKRFSLAFDILKAVIIFPLILIVYIYAGHTTHEKPTKTETHQKAEPKGKENASNEENAGNKENIIPQPSRKILVLNKISIPDVLKQEVLHVDDSISKIFNNLIHAVHHDSNIYLIVPPVDQNDSIKPI